MVIALSPTALLWWLLADPAHNQPWVIKLEHFVITSNVSIVAAFVGFLVARAALGVAHFRTLLVALGFASMAGIFAVHGLSTPDVLQQGNRAAAASLVVGVSGQLSLAVAALFFAVRYTALADWLERRLEARALTLATVVALAGYATVALGWPATFTGIAHWILVQNGAQPGYDPSTYGYGAPFLELDRRRGLERFLPPVVVERVIQGDPLRLEGERQTETILFTDLRDSTALAEKLSPEQTVATVNAYLRVMARCVLDAGGIVDKFTGDGLMATFGAISDPTDGAHAAARAALTMRTAIAKLNEERAARGELVVAFGIGMHTGDVILGAIGLPERSQYDAIGDAVNTASRMETLTKEYHVDAVLSKDTAERLRGNGVALRPLGEASVKGKANGIEVFTLS